MILSLKYTNVSLSMNWLSNEDFKLFTDDESNVENFDFSKPKPYSNSSDFNQFK